MGDNAAAQEHRPRRIRAEGSVVKLRNLGQGLVLLNRQRSHERLRIEVVGMQQCQASEQLRMLRVVA